MVANILSSPLKLMAPMLSARVAPGGALVLSGMLARQAEEVAAAYAPFIKLRYGPSRTAGSRWPADRRYAVIAMALATQCPHCHTTFRVAHDQLKLRAGLVRCGACKQIFNGIEHLLRPDERCSPLPALGTRTGNAIPRRPISRQQATTEVAAASFIAPDESPMPAADADATADTDIRRITVATTVRPTRHCADSERRAPTDAMIRCCA